MKGKVMSEIAKEQTKDDRSEIPDGDGGIDENLLVSFHG
jgi:hypothetical protein